MPFDAQGVFIRTQNFTSDRDNGTRILASHVDDEFNNMAAAFNTPKYANQILFNAPGIGDTNTAVALNDLYTKIAASGKLAKSRAQLRGMSASQGDLCYLNDSENPKCSGFFEKLDGNRTALLATDPYRGVYESSGNATDGSTGAWRRVIATGIYSLDWWNPTQLGNNGHLVLNSVFNFLPAGSVLRWGANIVTIAGRATSTLPLMIEALNPTVSRLEVAQDANYLGTTAMLRFRAAYSGVRNLGFAGYVIDGNANQPQCIGFEPLSYAPMPGCVVQSCKFERTCVAIATFAYEDDNLAAGPNAETTMCRPSKMLIADNDITTCRYGGLFFGIEDSDIVRNRVRADPAATSTALPTQGWTASFRVLGSKNVRITDNDLQLFTYNYNIANSALRLDELAYNANLRARNSHITFKYNTVREGNVLFSLADFDTHVICSNQWINPVSDSVQRTVFLLQPSNTSIYKIGDVVGEDTAYIGVTNFIQNTNGLNQPKWGTFRAGVRTLVRNNYSGAYPNNALVRMDYPAFKLIELSRIDDLGKAVGTYDLRLVYSQNVNFVMRDCVLSEQAGGGLIDTAGTTTINAGGDPTQTLTAVLTSGGTSYDASANTYPRQPAGLYNRLYSA